MISVLTLILIWLRPLGLRPAPGRAPPRPGPDLFFRFCIFQDLAIVKYAQLPVASGPLIATRLIW